MVEQTSAEQKMCPLCKQLCVPVREITNLEEHSFVLTVFTFLDLQSEGLSNLAALSSLALLSSLASLGQTTAPLGQTSAPLC